MYRYFSKYRDTYTPEEWDAAAEELGTMASKWEGTPLTDLANELLLAVYTEMERRYSKRKEAEAPRQG